MKRYDKVEFILFLYSLSNLFNSLNTFFQLVTRLNKSKNTWEDKLEAFVSLWPNDKFKISKENQRSILTSIYNRLIGLLHYDTSKLPQISASITLIKPTNQVHQMSDENYNLSEVNIF